MDDLISRQAAIDAICKACNMESDFTKCDGYHEQSEWCDYLVALRKVPSAEKHGRWIKENIVLTTNPVQYQWHCSECGMIKHWFTSEVLTNYCPNCGAKMDEVEE